MKAAMQKEKRRYTTITIPAPLFEKLQDKIKSTGFSSVSDYVTYILREMLIELEKKGGKGSNREDVISRLRALGYI